MLICCCSLLEEVSRTNGFGPEGGKAIAGCLRSLTRLRTLKLRQFKLTKSNPHCRECIAIVFLTHPARINQNFCVTLSVMTVKIALGL